jgi:hypothetical protein
MGFETEMRGIPEKYKKEVNDLIWKFLWDNKPIINLKSALYQLNTTKPALAKSVLQNPAPAV